MTTALSLTSLVMKCFEKIVPPRISLTRFSLPIRRLDDAILTLLYMVYKHLEGQGSVCWLFFCIEHNPALHSDTETHIRDFSLDRGLVLWVLDFMSQRSQRVKVGPHVPKIRTINTGSPQGCVLSPLLYTNSCTSSHPDKDLFTFAVETALISLLHDNEEHYGLVLNYDFVEWCDDTWFSITTRQKRCA